MADQPSSPSNFERIRAVVDKLADEEFEATRFNKPRQAATEMRKVLRQQDITAPKGLPTQLKNAPPAAHYQQLRAELDAYQEHLTSPEFVDGVFKPAAPAAFTSLLFGMHCAKGTKLACDT